MIWLIIGLPLSFYVGLTTLLFLFQNRLLYFPTRTLLTTPESVGLAYEPVEFEAEDGVKLSGWFVPGDGSDRVVLFFHGNAGNISHRLESIRLFHRLGLSVFIIDYRGYGQSEGRPSEQGTYLDAEAAWRFLIDERDVEPEQIILFGRSLGAAVAAWLAEHYQPGAVILESAFTSVPDMGASQFPFLPVRWLARIQYNTLERAPYLNAPVMVIHSPNDEIVPYSHGQQIFEAASEPKKFLEIKGGHNDGFIVSGEQYERSLKSFIDPD